LADRPCGSVVGVVKRAWRPYSCVLDPETAIGKRTLSTSVEGRGPSCCVLLSAPSLPAGSQMLAEPLDARIPKINITTRQVRCCLEAKRAIASSVERFKRRVPACCLPPQP